MLDPKSNPKPQKETPVTELVKRATRAAAPLGVLAFWGGMLMAARRYPSEYDWRYMTLSSLISPARNPSGHLWASAGIVLCGLGGLCWTALLARRWNHASAKNWPSGIRALLFGNFFMALTAVLPSWLLPVPKGHEILALFAFFGLCLGMIQLTFQTIERALVQRTSVRRTRVRQTSVQPTRSAVGRPRLYAAVLAGAAVLPIVMAGLAQAYVFYVLPELHWVSLAWRARGVPVYLSFAFWEWLTCVVLSAYMAILPLALSNQ
jgi:hypothetical protein